MESLINLQKAIQFKNSANILERKAKDFSILRKCIFFNHEFNETLFFKVPIAVKKKILISVGTTNELDYIILVLKLNRKKPPELVANQSNVDLPIPRLGLNWITQL